MGTDEQNRVRLLIVDDEPSICRALEIAFRRAGFTPVVAGSGDAALKLLHEQRFDVLLLDLRIPDLRGDILYDIAVGVQPHLRGHTLFVTGDITERAQSLMAACDCPIMSKPFDLPDLIAAVHAISPRVREASA